MPTLPGRGNGSGRRALRGGIAVSSRALKPPPEAPSSPTDDGKPGAGGIATLVGDSFVYGLGGFLARLAGIFLVPVYLAAAGTEAFGTAELVVSAVTVSAIVLRLGIVNSMTRFTLAEGRAADWAPVLHTIYAVVLTVSTVAAVAGVLARGALADVLHVGEGAAAAGVLGVWVTMNYDVLARLYRIQRRTRAFVGFQLANVAITIALTLVLVVALDQGAVGLLVGTFAGTGAVFVAMAWARRSSIGVRRFDRALAGDLLRYSLPLMPTNVAIWALNFADRLQVQRLAGPLELGQYAAAAKVAAGMTLFLGAFQFAWTPFAHALRGERGDEVAKRTYAQVFTLWAIGMGWALAAVSLLAAPYMALTFPAATRDAIGVVPLLAAGVALYGAYLIVNIGVTMTKRTRMTPVIAFAAGGVNVGLNFWFIPRFGIVGAGITTVIGYALLAALQWLNARRMYPISYEWGRVGRVVAFTAAVLALSAWVVPESGPVGIPVRVALALGYPAGLVGLGAVKLEELRRVPALLRSRRRTPLAADEAGE
ncbi:MAG: lipopolysaccharide biosynthesis protein [Actinomycetota bacterium]|nr:lipopolysaccharide biosynthesis protein [Actinomycetota bacterium]